MFSSPLNGKGRTSGGESALTCHRGTEDRWRSLGDRRASAFSGFSSSMFGLDPQYLNLVWKRGKTVLHILPNLWVLYPKSRL